MDEPLPALPYTAPEYRTPDAIDTYGRKYVFHNDDLTEASVRVRRKNGRIIFPEPDEELVLRMWNGRVCTVTVHEIAGYRTATALIRFYHPPQCL